MCATVTKMSWFIIKNDDVVSNSQPFGFLTLLVTFCNNWFTAKFHFLQRSANGNYFRQFKFAVHGKEMQGPFGKGKLGAIMGNLF